MSRCVSHREAGWFSEDLVCVGDECFEPRAWRVRPSKLEVVGPSFSPSHILCPGEREPRRELLSELGEILEAAASALGKLGSFTCIGGLVECVGERVRGAVSGALSESGGGKAKVDASRGARDWEVEVEPYFAHCYWGAVRAVFEAEACR